MPVDQEKVAAAVDRLDRVLPLRSRQRDLSADLRRAHRRVLRDFLHAGGPANADSALEASLEPGIVEALREAGLVVTDDAGSITGAYPFTVEPREHRVHTRHGEVRAMCAIDALGIAPMFGIDAVVESRCRLHGAGVRIRQRADGTAWSDSPVFAAIDWNAARVNTTCAASLCTEMFFIAGDAGQWRGRDPENRDAFDLDEAAAFAAALFVPLMQAER